MIVTISPRKLKHENDSFVGIFWCEIFRGKPEKLYAFAEIERNTQNLKLMLRTRIKFQQVSFYQNDFCKKDIIRLKLYRKQIITTFQVWRKCVHVQREISIIFTTFVSNMVLCKMYFLCM